MRLPAVGDLFLDRYRLEKEIGAGGFATVFAAHAPEGTLVALKVLTPGPRGYDRDTVGRFEREAAALAQLRDPHTVRMFESGTSPEGLLYMVFEYVPGLDLSEWLEQRGPLPPQAARHVLWQLLQSLQEAHARGLLHRDVKPENVRIYADGVDEYRAKLLDFGIAKPTGVEAASVTRTGELVGTPRYMSPEQLLSRPLTPASDIYSLGLVIIEALMGRDFLHGNQWSDQIDRLRSGYVVSVPELERIGPGLYSVLQRMVATNPAQRLSTAAAVLSALEEADKAPPVASPPPAAGSQELAAGAPQAVASNRGLHVAMAVLVVLIAAAVAALLALQRKAPEPVTVIVRPDPGVLLRSPEIVVEPLGAAEPDVGAHAEPAAPTVADAGAFEPCVAPFYGFDWLQSGGERWVTYVPDAYGTVPRHPLVVVLPPDHIQPALFVEQIRFDHIAEEEGAVLIAPFEGEQNAWADEEDVAFIHEQVVHTQEQLCIDPQRIYVVGHNNAGKAVERLTCESWVAAAAASSYRPNIRAFFCDAPPIPFLLLAPLKSGHLPVKGGVNCYGSEKVSHAVGIDRWKERHRCEGVATTHFEHATSKCSTWSCDVPFVACELDGGHGWPGTPPRPMADWRGCDGTPPDFPSERVVWDFFADKRLPARR